jgi:hypothetical protein
MKLNRSLLIPFVLLLVTASLYRALPTREFGFAPQIAMALFGGAVIRDKRWAFLLPLLSMVLSDLLYQVLYTNGLTSIPGFYEGQLVNYALICSITILGFFMRRITALRVVMFSALSSIIFFLLSNFSVWMAGAGYSRPKTWEGLMMCYYDGLAFLRDYGAIPGFYGNLFLGDLFYSALLFGSFVLLTRKSAQPLAVN